MSRYDFDILDESEVDKRYRLGTGTNPCPSCGQECEIQHSVTEFSEFIYCAECRMKFTRDRDAVFEHDYQEGTHSIIEVSREEKEGFVKFRCYRCDTKAIDQDYRTHEKTVASGEFEPVETGIHGYDECNLTCPCGRRHNAYINIGEVIECPCGRTYELSVKD